MADIDACEKEPIHLAGGIQPIGVLLILDGGNYRVIQASANTASLFGRSAAQLRGATLTELIDPAIARRVIDWHRSTQALSLQPIRFDIGAGQAPTLVDLVVHRIDDTLQVEILPVPLDTGGPVNLFQDLLALNDRIGKAASVASLLALAADEVAAVVRAQRVMVYEFDDAFHGTVTYETLAPGCTQSYMGLKFPASDIPPQARAMYLKNRIRVIADTGYRAVPLEPAGHPVTQQPADLTHALLRAVSPVHLEYLANMGVRGSMSISLVVNGALWGMIICHHDQPLLVSPDHRNYCEVVGQIVSLNIAQLLQIEASNQSLAAQQALLDMFPAQQSPTRFFEALEERAGALCALLAADGMLMKIGAKTSGWGHAINAATLPGLLALAGSATDEEIVETAALADALEQAGLPPATDIGGFLYIPIGSQGQDFLLFLRREQVARVTWAGNPTKTLDDTGTRLAPRKSFAQWQQTVRGQCIRWSPVQQRCARQLGILARDRLQLEAIKATREQLLQAEKMASIGQLAAGVAHEINTPIGFVSSNLGSLQRYWSGVVELVAGHDRLLAARADAGADLAAIQALKLQIDFDFLTEDTPELIGQSLEGITRVRDIVQNLKEFSHVDSQDQWMPADLVRAMETTLAIVQTELRGKADVVREYDSLPAVWCIPSLINQVFVNLLVNAGQALTEKGCITVRMKAAGDEVAIEIADTGKGIAPENLARIFEPFFTTRDVGQGTGLGLSIAYGIVEQHKGKLSVTSTPGQGATFRIMLPIKGERQ